MSAPLCPEVVIPANATVVRRETFREYFARVHQFENGRWHQDRERYDETISRFLETAADYIDAVTRK